MLGNYTVFSILASTDKRTQLLSDSNSNNPIKLKVSWNGKGRYADYIRLRKAMREWLQNNLTETTYITSSIEILFAYEEDLVAFRLRFPDDLYTNTKS